MLLVTQTHPVQYHAPLWRRCAQLGLPLRVVFGSDYSVAGYRDKGFGVQVKWDTDLLGGYPNEFLRTVATGAGREYSEVRGDDLLPVLRRHAPRAQLILGYACPFDRAAIRAGRQARLPLILRAENTDLTPRGRIKGYLRHLYLRWLYRRFAAFNFIGTRAREHLLAHGVDPGQMHFSPYAIDDSNYATEPATRAPLRSAMRAELGVDPARVVLLFSGKLSPIKAPDLLLRAAARLPETLRRNLVLCFLGDGELRTSLEQTAPSTGVDTRFLGFRNQTELSRVYSGADLVVMPTRTSETWGLTVNEALLHGLPIVVSDSVSSAIDLVEPGISGEIFARDDAASLCAAIERVWPLIGQVDGERLAERMRRYDLEHAARGVIAAYEAVVR